MSNIIILSIHKQHADNIFSGKKIYEFRKNKPNKANFPYLVLLYETQNGGVYLLGIYSEKYEDKALVLMAYNMGDYGASTLWEQGVHSTAYTEKVLTKYKEFKEANYGRR